MQREVTGCRSKCQEERRWWVVGGSEEGRRRWAVRPGLAPLYNPGLLPLTRVLLASNKTRTDEAVPVKSKIF